MRLEITCPACQAEEAVVITCTVTPDYAMSRRHPSLVVEQIRVAPCVECGHVVPEATAERAIDRDLDRRD